MTTSASDPARPTRAKGWCGGRSLGGIIVMLVWMMAAVGSAAPGGVTPGPDPRPNPDTELDRLRRALALRKQSAVLFEQKKYGEAIPLQEQACSIVEDVIGEHGKDAVALASCLQDLATMHVTQGAHGTVQSMLERAISIKERALGPEDGSLIVPLANLAMLHHHRGAYERAAALYERLLSIVEKTLGPDHPEVAASLNNLATLYRDQGAYAKAEPLLKRALALTEKALGAEHPSVVPSLNNLAISYQDQGAYAKAEPLLKRALSLVEKARGPSHPDVAVCLNNLATLYMHQGSHERAEPLLERALLIMEEALGPDHLNVATVLNSLASLHQAQGAYEEAAPLFARALAITEKALGPDHPTIANRLNNLASMHYDQGALGKAGPLFERALAITEKALGPDHPHVATSLNNLAMLYQDQGAYGRAEPLFERALSIHERALGPAHPSVATSLGNLAALYQDQGSYDKARPLFERALAITEKALGPAHPSVAAKLNNLAMVHHRQQEHEEARRLYERALAIEEDSLGPRHPSVAIGLGNLATFHLEQGAYARAQPLYERALAITEGAFGPRHPSLAVHLGNLASLHHEQHAYELAQPLYERALAITEETYGPYHPSLAVHLGNLASLHHAEGERDSALQLRRRAFAIEEHNLVRTLVVAEDTRRLSFATTLSSSLHEFVSSHLRQAPDHRPAAELALTALLSRKARVQDLIAQSNAALRRSLPAADQHLLDELSLAHARYAAQERRGPGELSPREFSERLGELRAQEDRLWTELARHSALVRSRDRPITIAAIQAALGRGSALLELVRYYPYHDDTGLELPRHEAPNIRPRYAAYLVLPDRIDWVDLGPAKPIDDHVAAFRRALQLEQAIPTDLHHAIMQPVLARLDRDTRRLIIAPDGDLHIIPFGALYDGERYLVERYALRVVTTGRELLAPAPEPLTTTAITIVANPLGANLSGAEREADFLTALLPEARVLLRDQATEGNVRAVERPLILHMATHGFFDAASREGNNPMLRSGLRLADAGPARPGTKGDPALDDGQLTAYEVSGLDLRGTQLVVLSACETGLGALKVSEGVLGLRRAFAMAGAQTQVMSLWQVGDVTASKVMEAYYLELGKGRGRGDAMQAVQLQLLRSDERAHPKHWAAFVVTGSDAPLRFPPGQSPAVAAPAEGPPPHRGRGGCSVAASSSDRARSLAPLLLALLLAAGRGPRRSPSSRAPRAPRATGGQVHADAVVPMPDGC